MKILVLTSRLPWPLDKGDKLRAYHQIRELANNHEVYLFCLASGKEKHLTSELSPLQQVTKGLKIQRMSTWKRISRLVFAPLSSRPFQVHWFYQRAAEAILGCLGPGN